MRPDRLLAWKFWNFCWNQIKKTFFVLKFGWKGAIYVFCANLSISVDLQWKNSNRPNHVVPNRRTGSNLFAIEKTSTRRPIAGKVLNNFSARICTIFPTKLCNFLGWTRQHFLTENFWVPIVRLLARVKYRSFSSLISCENLLSEIRIFWNFLLKIYVKKAIERFW